jgi:hypothetical protein
MQPFLMWLMFMGGALVGWLTRRAFELMNKDIISVDKHAVVSEIGKTTVTVTLPNEPNVHLGDIVRFEPTRHRVPLHRVAEYRRHG